MRYNKCVSIIILIFLIFIIDFPTCISNSNFYFKEDNNLKTEIVLVTGFGPFGVYEINPSQLIVENLDGQNIEGAEIIGIILPVDFSASVENITNAIDTYNPNIIISTGLSPSAKKINVEKIGINIKMYTRNETLWFIPRILEKFGPMFRFSTLDTKEIVSNMKEIEIPSRQSYYAGFYICNAVLYGTLGYIKENQLSIDVGFIHVPQMISQDPEGMELHTMIEGMKIAIKTSLN